MQNLLLFLLGTIPGAIFCIRATQSKLPPLKLLADKGPPPPPARSYRESYLRCPHCNGIIYEGYTHYKDSEHCMCKKDHVIIELNGIRTAVKYDAETKTITIPPTMPEPPLSKPTLSL